MDAYQTVADRAMTLRQSLLDQGCDQSHLETVECTVKHRSNLFDASDEPPPYRATEVLVVRCRLQQVRDRVETGLGTGAELVEVQPELPESRRAELRSTALTEATNDARARAEAIADAEAVELGRLIDISEKTADGMRSLVDAALEGAGTDNIVPGPVDISARVSATFEVNEPNS